ncbi:MAG: ARPP-1 family domain-containing protein, partial [Planctomycetota bacterium]
MSRPRHVRGLLAAAMALFLAGCGGEEPAAPPGPAGGGSGGASAPRTGSTAATPAPTSAGTPAPAPTPDGRRISGPYTQGNLSVFLVHGKDRFAGKKILTLKEAMDQKKVVVHETGNVQQLS